MIPMSMEKNETSSIGPSNKYNAEYIIEVLFDRFSKGLRIIGPIFAFALTTFVFVVTHAFFNIILPYWNLKYGILIGIILTILAFFLLFSVLFNYFLAVLVKPGSLEDIRSSKFYRKNDPLSVSYSVVNWNSVLLNKSNQKGENNLNKSENEMKLRLKVNNSSDGINKEDHLITYSNLQGKEKQEKINEENSQCEQSSLEIDDESFSKHLESKLETISELEDKNDESKSDQIITNYSQEKEINEYYGINSINNPTVTPARLSDCKYCKQPKVIRSHHCTICGYCVMKMDHHCPWINNCVGQNNHRYFMLFLTHTFFGCIFVCLTSIPILFNSRITKTMEFNFVAILSFVGFILLIFFNSWNWFLVLKGNTTIEYWSLKAGFGNAAIKDFSMPNWRDNIFMVFGTHSLFNAIFIPSVKKLPYSGLEWTKLAVPSFDFGIIGCEDGKDLRISKIDNEINI
jgi:hypothetical protein